MPFGEPQLLPVAVSLALALALTPLVRAAARWRGFVAKPRPDRWHQKPTAMMGGAAIFLAVALTYLAFIGRMPHRPYGWVVMCASTFLFLVGLIDDLLHVKPYQKLVGQLMGAAVVVYYGLALPWTGSAL